MKDYIILEINSKKETLDFVQIATPTPYILCNNMEAVMNNRIFNEFMDEIFSLAVDELQNDYDVKINNVYVTFFDRNDVSVCSFILDKLKPKRRTYRLRSIDWEIQGCKFKYVKQESKE